MHYKEQQIRAQKMIVSYDSMISPDNPVRLIDLICKKFISENPLKIVWKGSSSKGRKSYPAQSMLSLLVYGYFNGIASSRRMERETYRNIEMIWLMESLQPDHWTICDFRRNNEQLIKELLKSFRKFLLDGTYATGNRLVFDGSKVKAYASRDMLKAEGIAKKLEDIDKSLAEFMSQMESNDTRDDELETAREEIRLLREKIEKLEVQKSKLESARKILETSGKKQIALNDIDAVLVKGRDGKFAGYNVQNGVEPKGHFIMSNEVTTDANDLNQLGSRIERAKEDTGLSLQETVADCGFGNMSQIIDIEENGIQCYVPLQASYRDKEKEGGSVFEYDKEDDTYLCSQGKRLHLYAKKQKHHGGTYNIYKCRECDGCPARNSCTKSKTGRIYRRNIEQERIDLYKEKLKSNYSKERIAERKGIVEHPFGTIKWLMGKYNFLLKGKEKTQIESDLYTTAYNIKRLINCTDLSVLMGKVIIYNWAMA